MVDPTKATAQVVVTAQPKTTPAPVTVAHEESEEDDISGAKVAEIEPPKKNVTVVGRRVDDPNKLVKIRPRQTLGRVAIGKNDQGETRWYQINANVELLVPLHVKRLFEEKGII